MPKFQVSVPNLLGRDAALQRLQGFSQKLQEEHADKIKDLEQRWEGDELAFGFKTLGIRIEGRVAVEDTVVRVEGDLPFAAAMFKGQITGAIQEQLQRLLG
jgi:hypothetical protein